MRDGTRVMSGAARGAGLRSGLRRGGEAVAGREARGGEARRGAATVGLTSGLAAELGARTVSAAVAAGRGDSAREATPAG